VVTLPGDFDAAGCQFEYLLEGAFGGYYAPARLVPGTSRYQVEAVHGGVVVKSLKAALYCPGYHTETITFSTLTDAVDRNVQIRPRHLGTVTMAGKVLGLRRETNHALRVAVSYAPSWMCDFFGLMDCLLPYWPIARVPLPADGRFSVDLPDLARDAVVSSCARRGAFYFDIEDANTGTLLYRLRREDGARSMGEVPVAGAYPITVSFQASRVR
jgi:hypothetical protein